MHLSDIFSAQRGTWAGHSGRLRAEGGGAAGCDGLLLRRPLGELRLQGGQAAAQASHLRVQRVPRV